MTLEKIHHFFMQNRTNLSLRNIFYLILMIASSGVYGQILNIEKYRSDGDSLKNYAVHFNGAFNVNNRSAGLDNPVKLLGYNFTLNSIYTPKKHAFIFIAHRNFLRINENPFINFGYFHGRVNFYRKNRLNFELFTQLSDDNFRGLNPRILGGSSLRYRVVDRDSTELIVSTGVFYEYENWMHPVTQETVTANFVKSTTNIVFRHSFSKALSFNMIVFYQVGYDKSISALRNRVSSNIHLNSKITKRLSLVNYFEFAYEDKPIVPITKFLYSYRIGLGIDL